MEVVAKIAMVGKTRDGRCCIPRNARLFAELCYNAPTNWDLAEATALCYEHRDEIIDARGKTKVYRHPELCLVGCRYDACSGKIQVIGEDGGWKQVPQF